MGACACVSLKGGPVGVQGSGRIRVWVAKKGVLLGSIEIDDPVRADAAASVSLLQSLGLRTYLLSG
jgi:cation transport ATPase